MIPPNLQGFLQNCKTQSLPFETVEPQLVKAGWSPAYVEEARKWYTPQSPTIQSQSGQVATVLNAAQTKTPQTIPTPPGSRGKTPLFFIPIVIILLLLGTTILGAYNIIPLPNTELFIKARLAIIGLPFMPKTTEYVLVSSTLANQKIKQMRLDMAMNFSSKNLTSMIGSENVALRISGPIDLSNINNPKFAFNITLGEDYDFDMQIEDKIIYLKVNQLSTTLLSAWGVDENVLSSYFNKWMAYDLSPFMKDEKKTKKSKNTVEFDEEQVKALTDLAYEKILPIMRMTQEKLNNESAYKIHLDIDGKMLDDIEKILYKKTPTSKQPKTKLSESIKKIYLDMWISPKTYLTMKTAINVDYIVESKSSSGSLFTVGTLEDESGKFSITGSFSNYNKPVEIKIPINPLKPEEVMMQIMQSSKLYNSQYNNLNTQQSELNYYDQYYQPSYTY